MLESEPGLVVDHGWVLYAASWPLFGICFLIISLRLWVRAHMVRSLGWDDAFMILAFLCAAINTILVTISVQYGTGRHASNLTEYQQSQSIKYQVLSAGFHVMSTNWGKVSVALFLIRIISEVKNHKLGMYALIIVMTIINTGAVITIFAQCQPTAAIWDHSLAGPQACWPPDTQKKYSFFQAAASALTDLILAIYPLFTIKDLQMPTKVKLGLGFVLSLGLVAMVAAIIKATHLPDMASYEDYTWDTINLTIWVSLEQYLIILAACIPALTPLFNIIVRRASNRSKSKSKSMPNDLLKGDSVTVQSLSRKHKHGSRSRGRSRDFALTLDSNSSQHQQYNPFARVGREYVEYPLTWTTTTMHTATDLHHPADGSDSETPISGFHEEPEMPTGILRTTDFRLEAVSNSRNSAVRWQIAKPILQDN
ncbi:hypothetical protein AN8971.2 [Aspergillus nidulans FGSC A4]|uniref:Integral membrane protein (AFU_orthologue AFUA_5G13725) n=1 Tax=Emericella nidulans (strain FGSC A4 / ATCC 38163 / CBS 112.46 / NRRL 194 / M139) TaxID=227321 RepID=Q5ARV9_EMENI|nr:hypothetical protein [Aspergillus nidulans FGSC A4]EAA63766.1 hypothetical protein AN8971.2 [Aspergillus nidulans FGSC A4]CBF84542.1 TPA: integral membrane protein (AFU_orthologue; AFUA_5G13725) [Aspergillus nidulans FGSC A4]|eukprot:XP_682240.1 hypothetical protein AN8971.2 [Aspergillus nidulans FGSC A4]